MNKKFLVSQSYSRGYDHFDDIHRVDILVTDYDDLNYAKVHYNAVKNDKYASIIYLDRPEHLNKLEEMISGDKYAVYWSVVKSSEDLKKRLDDHYSENVKRYIEKNTTWRIKSGSTIHPRFEVIFGELFLIIKYNSQTLRVKFEEIERI